MILGIDEVGRGPWAGPLVVGAVVLPENFTIPGLTDSKKLSAKKRTAYDTLIREQALGFGLGWVDASEIDAIGLSAALRLATVRAVDAVKTPYHEIIIDGTINFLQETTKGKHVTVLPKADALIPAVSAASIIAKVARDTYMEKQALIYPEYGFEAHVGYGTARHIQALHTYGTTPLHRRSFAPIAALEAVMVTSNSISSDEPNVHKAAKNTTSIGRRAEDDAAQYLKANGYAIQERNWRTRSCEIDIIATKDGIYYFVEVKFRSSTKYGGGVAALTPAKLKQMRYGAEVYTARVAPSGHVDQRLMGAVVDTDGTVELIQLA